MFFGWKVVAVSFVIAVFAWGLGFYGPSVYVAELTTTRGWPVAIVSGAVTFHFLFSAALIFWLADAHRRWGIARVTSVGLISFALGAVGWAHAVEPWHLYPAAALTGIGWSATSGAAINTWVAPWFERKRGLALSQAYTGASIGGVLMTPIWVATINRFGFELASILIAGFGLLLILPLVVRYLGRTPSELGTAPDGEPRLPSSTVDQGGPEPRTRRALLADPRFVSLSLAFSIGIFAQMGLITHLIVRLVPALGDNLAALGLSLATACAIIGRFLLAWLAGERHRRLAGAINFLTQAVGTVLLIIGDTGAALIAGCVLFGLGIGNLLSLPPLILQSEQPRQDVAQALALLTSVNQLLYAFAPGLVGVVRDLTGSYTIPFLAAAVAQVLSALVLMRHHRRTG